ncbi:hypothetical protein KFL_000030610 [Klebsormidium nitens]|uniref:Apple domain-containing protein n=1 Tax=Klebsormidium nitens TaxID=105231 RepID=A0A1Y1HH74_KLENI|nr:hypothetical protein KFL_000030610 [Klebsormidium nitens]|eukprot:GAQ77785.1 hypothetical protein KFL_000030610 [Klebsormidium nitens]
MAPVTSWSSSTAAGMILAFLLVGTTLGLAAAQAPFTYIVQVAVDYPFYDIQPSPGPPGTCGGSSYGENATACEARCNATAVCVGFVHRSPVNCCFIKSRLLFPRLGADTTSYVKAPLGYTYTVQNATDYPGYDFRPLPLAGPTFFPPLCGDIGVSESAAACEIRCNAVDSCAGFVHYPFTNCCFLKFALPPANQKSDVTVNSYVKTAYLGYSVEFGLDYFGFPITVPGAPTSPACTFPPVGQAASDIPSAIAENLNACVARCDSTPACLAIAHYAVPNCCILWSTVAAPDPKPGAVYLSRRVGEQFRLEAIKTRQK